VSHNGYPVLRIGNPKIGLLGVSLLGLRFFWVTLTFPFNFEGIN